MYPCLNFPLYISKLAKIAWAEWENGLQCKEKGQRRDLRSLTAIFAYFSQNIWKHTIKEQITSLIHYQCLAPGRAGVAVRCGAAVGLILQRVGCTAAAQCCRRSVLMHWLWCTNTQLLFHHIKGNSSMHVCNSNWPFYDSVCFIYSAVSRCFFVAFYISYTGVNL